MIRNLIVLLCALFLTAELAVRISSIDTLMLKPLLYYQGSDPAAHEPSPNPERIYQLKPGARTRTTEFMKPVSVNSLGFRGTGHPASKTPGTTRVICLGGSTTYGAAVADNETFPYYLEEILNKKYKGKFEVWNAGLCAYVLSGEIAYAREIIAKYDPDILIFQYANIGRRPFLPGMRHSPYFRSNPELFIENLRYIPFPNSPLSLWMLRHSAAYRCAVVLANCFMFMPSNNPQYNSETPNMARFSSFFAENRNRIKIFIMPSKDWHDSPSEEFKKMLSATGASVLDIFSAGRLPPNASSEYYLTHPPAHVYKWYAEAISGELSKYGAVSKK